MLSRLRVLSTEANQGCLESGGLDRPKECNERMLLSTIDYVVVGTVQQRRGEKREERGKRGLGGVGELTIIGGRSANFPLALGRWEWVVLCLKWHKRGNLRQRPISRLLGAT